MRRDADPPARCLPLLPAAPPTPTSALPPITYERYPGAAAAPLPAGYRPRRPEQTALHTIVRAHLETFLAEPLAAGADAYPRFIERAFRRYLDCGVLARGFARLRCPDCGFERLVPFSCKSRLCPSCNARRMAETAALLVENVWPQCTSRIGSVFISASIDACSPVRTSQSLSSLALLSGAAPSLLQLGCRVGVDVEPVRVAMRPVVGARRLQETFLNPLVDEGPTDTEVSHHARDGVAAIGVAVG